LDLAPTEAVPLEVVEIAEKILRCCDKQTGVSKFETWSPLSLMAPAKTVAGSDLEILRPPH
jgi:hypothetical protein